MMSVQKVNNTQLSVVVRKEESQKFRKPQNVLDEDTFTESLEKIITKDFFPDLIKLNAQAEYFDAVERNDTHKLWQLRQRFTRPPTGITTPSVFSTPSTFETPETRLAPTPVTLGKDVTVGTPLPDKPSEKVEQDPAHNPEPKDPLQDVSLDKFLARNTSEDNVSFVEIMKEAEKKHRLKHAWLFDKEQEQLNEQEQFLELPTIEQQAIASTSKNLQTWTYIPANAVMYVPESVPESAAERIERMAVKPQEIIHRNTRFTTNPFNQQKSQETISNAASVQAMLLQGKIGADGKEILPTQTPTVGGYGFVATPSPAPGVDASPLMTWGEIEGTPFRLDGSDTPLINRTPGPTFKIPDTPRRDRLLFHLAEKASKAHRAKKQEALKQCQASFNQSPSPKSSSCKTDRLLFLSPAAQRLATKKFGIRPNTGDKALRASYTPSPGHRAPGEITPVPSPGGTPQSSKTPGSSRSNDKSGSNSNTPNSVVTPGRKTPSRPVSITDDLLQLPKRSKAQEYF